MILTDANIFTWKMTCSTLTNDDITCDDALATINFDTEAFTV